MTSIGSITQSVFTRLTIEFVTWVGCWWERMRLGKSLDWFCLSCVFCFNLFECAKLVTQIVTWRKEEFEGRKNGRIWRKEGTVQPFCITLTLTETFCFSCFFLTFLLTPFQLFLVCFFRSHFLLFHCNKSSSLGYLFFFKKILSLFLVWLLREEWKLPVKRNTCEMKWKTWLLFNLMMTRIEQVSFYLCLHELMPGGKKEREEEEEGWMGWSSIVIKRQ